MGRQLWRELGYRAVGVDRRAHSGDPRCGPNPNGISADGTRVWIADYSDRSVGELSASTGALVQSLNYGFSAPVAISSDGSHVWVANRGNNSVAEMSASGGSPLDFISGPSYDFNAPDAVSTDGTHVWVANQYGNSVTEMSASTGALIQVIGGIISPDAVSSDGTHVWVAGGGGTYDDGSVTVGVHPERSSRPSQTPKAASLPATAPSSPRSRISSDGTHVWVAMAGGGGAYDPGSVTELSASTGAVIQNISAPTDCVYNCDFDEPNAISSDGTHVWITNGGNGYFTELSASTGAITQASFTPFGASGEAPDAVSSDGTHVWIAYTGLDVSELSASTGAPIQEYGGAGLNGSVAISSDGTNVWLANGQSDSVTGFPTG